MIFFFQQAVKRSGSNVFSMFSTQQVAEFKEVSFLFQHENSNLRKEPLTWPEIQ